MTSATKYDHPGGYNPAASYPWSADRQLLSWVPKDSDVLELGCATGYMGDYLRREKHCRVTGVDAHEQALAVARSRYDRVVQADLDKPETLASIGGTFDVILCAAVLEHLHDPAKTIGSLKPLLKRDGVFLISLPNIAHWSIRSALVRGHFDYSEYGILDNTHLRFFTYHSSQEFLRRSGLVIRRVSIDPDAGIPYLNGLIRRLPGGWSFLKWFYELRPNLFAYQTLFEAAKV